MLLSQLSVSASPFEDHGQKVEMKYIFFVHIFLINFALSDLCGNFCVTLKFHKFILSVLYNRMHRFAYP